MKKICMIVMIIAVISLVIFGILFFRIEFSNDQLYKETNLITKNTSALICGSDIIILIICMAILRKIR